MHNTNHAVLDNGNGNSGAVDSQASRPYVSTEELLQVFMMVAGVYETSDKPVKLASIINANESKVIDLNVDRQIMN